jgi:hypothetical protein
MVTETKIKRLSVEMVRELIVNAIGYPGQSWELNFKQFDDVKQKTYFAMEKYAGILNDTDDDNVERMESMLYGFMDGHLAANGVW